MRHEPLYAGSVQSDPFSTFIGLPTTAMLYAPFAVLGAAAYRSICVTAFGIALYLAGMAVPPKKRGAAWATGALCLGVSYGAGLSIELGQVDAWIVLVLALAALAVQRNRWSVAGVGLGIAALLKISPGLLLVYCAARRRVRVMYSGAVTIAAGLLLSALPRHGRDILTFVHDVAPRLSGATVHVQNQSLAAALARLTAAPSDLLRFDKPLGMWPRAGVVVALSWLAFWAWLHRRRELRAAELSGGIIAILLAGPLTWDHYLSWMFLPLILLWPVPPLGIVALALLLALPTLYVIPQLFEPPVPIWVRIASSLPVFALLGMATIAARDVVVAKDPESPDDCGQRSAISRL
jgi:alpha-1,2-mannosyltransferase